MLKRINIVLGKTGAGKSYFVKNKIIPNIKGNLIIFDVMNEYFYNNFLICNDYYSFLNLLKWKKRHFKIIVKTSNINEIFNIQSFIFKYLKDITIILEEAFIYLNNNIYDFINFGRHKNICLVLIGRRGSEFRSEILALTEKIFIFKTTSFYDIIYYKKIFGLNDTDLEKLKNLETGQYLEFTI